MSRDQQGHRGTRRKAAPTLSRRQWLLRSLLASSGLALGAVPMSRARRALAATGAPFRVHDWQRDARNPILPPGPNDFDATCCMNPFVLRRGDEYWMFYAGGDRGGLRRVCLAIAPVDDLTRWRRLGPLFDVGAAGSFDAGGCLAPCVHLIDGKWHLYYTGKGVDASLGLQDFTGIGLATSDDLKTWTRHGDEPVLRGDGIKPWPDNRGIAGTGTILELPQPDGRTLLRMYYTLALGRPSKSVFVDQSKRSAVAHSYDGLEWFDKRVVLGPRDDADYENVATIGLNVFATSAGYRAIYGAIGTRFGAYSICEATSDDGLEWHRGEPGENLSLAPTGDGWESKMVEYPHVIEENGRLRLFYCGNAYGRTGIGTAVAEKLSAD